jgi:HAD superfamily hydrolase (TIGR01450 family)
LVDAYDLIVFDLDGVIYLIDRPIPGAVQAVAQLHREGKPLAYATNNASRRSAQVAELLIGLGVPARPDEVLTSAAAAASELASRLPSRAPVLVVGADALRAEVDAAGLLPVANADEAPAAVVQGYGPQVGWAELAEACLAVRAGALWVATNTDRTLPSPRGPLPGNGALVAALRTALDRDPDIVVGKPAPGLFATAARRAQASRPLVVGDRLDTDIEGADRAGMDSLLVLTGVTTATDLLAAPPGRRPTYVAGDLAGLFDVDGVVRVPDGADGRDSESGGWWVTLDGAGLRLSGEGSPLEALRALCAVAWSGRPVGEITPESAPATQALRALGLTA